MKHCVPVRSMSAVKRFLPPISLSLNVSSQSVTGWQVRDQLGVSSLSLSSALAAVWWSDRRLRLSCQLRLPCRRPRLQWAPRAAAGRPAWREWGLSGASRQLQLSSPGRSAHISVSIFSCEGNSRTSRQWSVRQPSLVSIYLNIPRGCIKTMKDRSFATLTFWPCLF